MKILHAANFALYPSGYQHSNQLACYYNLDRSISYGLTQHKHCVFDFGVEDAFRRYRQPWPWRSKRKTGHLTNDILVRTALRFDPDLLLLGHAKDIHPETLDKLRTRLPSLKIAQWWVDPLDAVESVGNLNSLAGKLPYLDALFTTTSSEHVREALQAGAHAGKIHFMPNICNTSVCTGRAFECTEHAHSALFTGMPDKGRSDLMQHFRSDKFRHTVDVYGETKESMIGGAKYIDAISRTKIGISINRYIIPFYSSDRMIHITGNGAMALCAYSPGLEKLFSKEEVVYFHTADEFDKQLHHYLDHDSERQTVARKGWERAHSDYNERRITQFILDTLSAKSSGSVYHWSHY